MVKLYIKSFITIIYKVYVKITLLKNIYIYISGGHRLFFLI